MRCLRIDLRRKFSLYLNGELEADSIKRIEDHLLDCGSCRTRLAHLRNGHRLAQELPRFTPRSDPWAAIEAAIIAPESAASQPRVAARWREVVLKPGFALATISVIALIGALLITYGTRAPGEERSESLVAEALDPSQFHMVSIAGIDQNQKPHVVAEGFVSEVIADEDGDLRFRLVDELGRPGPFIVCEIIDPIRVRTPSVGSRVRVYGVSRYDSQPDHNWYEVHPVLNIEVVKH
ncbi:MAG: zf-HC2 domain-containing protein [Acidobacteriota bacterium]